MSEALDKRTDDEILQSLTQHVPITSEKNIWGHWDSGIGMMPAWCQRNIVTWIRLCSSTWTVRILDNIPGSPNNALSWIEADMLPKTFVEGRWMDRIRDRIVLVSFVEHAFILLVVCGWILGLYLSARLMISAGSSLKIRLRLLKSLIYNPPSGPDLIDILTMVVPWIYEQVMANHFAAGRKGDLFIEHW